MTRTILTAALALGMALAAAYGVKPTTVTHTAEADFASGQADGVAVWSLGEVTLGPKVRTLLEGRDDVDLVTALAVGADGVVYAGTAPKGLVLRIAGEGEPAVLADLDSAVIAAIRVEGARLVVATAGNAAGLYTVALPDAAPEAPVEAEPLWVDDAVTAVWGFTRLGETYYAATAPEGKLFAVRADGAEAIFTARQKALRSIAGRGTALYFGTGEDGLVYRFDLADRDARVLLDAPQKEIVALALGGDGSLYVAATDVSGEPSTPAAAEDVGRPERTTASDAAPALGGDDDDGDDGAGEEAPQAGEREDAEGEPAADEAEVDGPAVDEPETDAPAADALDAAAPTTAPAAAAGPASAPASAPAGELAGTIARARPVDTAPGGTSASAPPRTAPGGAARSAGAAGGEGGNSVYCIQPDGLVRVVVQRKATLMDMVLVERDGQRVVFLATAGEGQIVEARPDTGDAATVVDIDPEIVTSLAAGPDGALCAGTASPATVVRLAEATADEGTLISKPIDAEQFARWSQLRVDADVPAGAAVTIATRTGNLEEAEDDTWSSWSAELPADGAWQPIGSPAGRFLQYRLTLTPSPAGLAGTVTRLDLTRQVGNLAPEIAGIAVEPSAQPQARPGGGNQPEGPKRYRLLRVQASDPNEDDLRLDVFARRRGTEVWIRIAKDLEEPQYAWDTQTVPDGEYEVRVVASDSPGNPPSTALTDSWISRPVTVDNAGPALVELTARADMPAAIVFRGTASVTARFRDAGSRLEKVEYVVDSGETWAVLEPADGVYDTPAEQVSARIDDLEHGPHLITLRATDEYGNVTYATAEVSIAP